MAHDFERAVRDHLVRVHVGGRAGAALYHVDDELLQQRAASNVLAGLGDHPGLVVVEQAQLVVGESGRFLDACKGNDEVGIDRDRGSRDREVFQRTNRVHAVVGVARNRALPEQIVFAPKTIGSHRATFPETERRQPTMLDKPQALG